METPEELGRRLVREMRNQLAPGELASAGGEAAADVLRWRAESLSDEQLWAAVSAALDEAREDGEYWALGDGVVDESVRSRPSLERRWREARKTNPKVAEVYRVMQDPKWNWTNPDRWGE